MGAMENEDLTDNRWEVWIYDLVGCLFGRYETEEKTREIYDTLISLIDASPSFIYPRDKNSSKP